MVERRLSRAAAVLALTALAGCTTAAAPRHASEPRGYLGGEALERLAAGVADAATGAAAGDRAVLEAAPPGSDRWWLATAHAELRPSWAAQHFDCALGTRLAERPRPALARAMGRLAADVRTLAARAAQAGGPGSRLRPFAAIKDLQPCIRVEGAERAAAGPSAAAILAGAYGELFADLAPDVGAASRRMAREIAYSRAVCRVDWPADVETGLGLGAELYRRASLEAAFIPDIEAARAEIAAARSEGLASPACAAERRALGQWSAPPRP